MIVVRGTKKFLDRVGRPDTSYESSTSLGDWYANALFWRPQVALFVNAQTLFPVLVALAPASSVGTPGTPGQCPPRMTSMSSTSTNCSEKD